MGCDYSKQTKNSFTSSVQAVDSQVAALKQKKQKIEELFRKLTEPETQPFNPQQIHADITGRLEKLEEILKEVQVINLSSSESQLDLREETGESSSDSMGESLSIGQESRVIPELSSIVDDPDIKAMVLKKRMQLEEIRQKEAAAKKIAKNKEAKAILEDPEIIAIVAMKRSKLSAERRIDSPKVESDIIEETL